MTLLQYETTLHLVDSPLSQSEDYSYWVDEGSEIDPARRVKQRMALILIAAIFFMAGFSLVVVRNLDFSEGTIAQPATSSENNSSVVTTGTGGIAPLFTAEVQQWAPQIIAWSASAGVDPNMAATVMQIESCGDPNAVSVAGAQGLFQVMPFHFSPGETMQDPDTNAGRGLKYLAEGMRLTGGNAGLSFAGYNGGHGTAARAYENWPAETQRYHTWSTGIYEDANQGATSSATLENWLAAGGAGLCRQAATRLGLP